MIEYPKIETLFDRGEDFRVIEGHLRLPEFGMVNPWLVTEKIDGTNIRVYFGSDDEPRFGGRTDAAQIPVPLLNYLQDTFTREKMLAAFPEASGVTLFGEGYGPKIQKGGGNYRADPAVRLFDVRVGEWWLNWPNVEDVAQKLGIQTVPVINRYAELAQIVPIVKSLKSEVALVEAGNTEIVAEGVVCRTDPLLFTRRGDRLIFKLKAKDFVVGRR